MPRCLPRLTEGASALVLRIGESVARPRQLDRCSTGVFLSLVPVILDAGAEYPAACDVLLALLAQVDPDQRAICRSIWAPTR